MRTRVGYAGGTSPHPTYRRIGDHSEAVEIDYDPARISFEDLLDEFWRMHDPRRPAYSVQYRSAVFYRTDEERRAAEASRSRIEAAIGPVTTVIEELRRFYRAEDYHQKYRLRARRDVMSSLGEVFPDDRSLIDSTLAARINGWLDGCGGAEDLERELSRLGLDDDVAGRLRALVSGPGADVSRSPALAVGPRTGGERRAEEAR